MSENDGWQHQGRQEHGWFGNGTKPTDAAANAGFVRAGLTARMRGGGGRSWRWSGSRLVAERRSQPVAPLPFAPLPLPDPYLGAEAAARAQRRGSGRSGG